MTLLLFGLFFILMLLGVPIAFAIGASSLYALFQADVPLMVVTQQMFQGINSFALVAIPMFILAGDLMAQGKVSERLVSFADSLVGFMRGGLSIVSIMAGMFFAAISGSGAATTAAVGATLVPELKRKGYDPASAASMQINESPDLEAFQAAVAPVYEQYGEQFGDFLPRIQAELE